MRRLRCHRGVVVGRGLTPTRSLKASGSSPEVPQPRRRNAGHLRTKAGPLRGKPSGGPPVRVPLKHRPFLQELGVKVQLLYIAPLKGWLTCRPWWRIGLVACIGEVVMESLHGRGQSLNLRVEKPRSSGPPRLRLSLCSRMSSMSSCADHSPLCHHTAQSIFS
jgi:hypothetical protein